MVHLIGKGTSHIKGEVRIIQPAGAAGKVPDPDRGDHLSGISEARAKLSKPKASASQPQLEGPRTHHKTSTNSTKIQTMDYLTISKRWMSSETAHRTLAARRFSSLAFGLFPQSVNLKLATKATKVVHNSLSKMMTRGRNGGETYLLWIQRIGTGTRPTSPTTRWFSA